MSSLGTKRRVAFCTACLTLVMAVLGAQLAFLHLRAGRLLQNKYDRQVRRKVLASRGRIHDRKGTENILALNLAVRDVCVDPARILASNCVDEVASGLSESLGVPEDEVKALLQKRASRRFAYVKRFVPTEQTIGIEKRDLLGVFFREETIRFYPHRSFLCHVLGFVNHEGMGSAGVEQLADRYLRGSSGLVEGCVNGLSQEVYSQRGLCIPALAGAGVILTIDQNIQNIVEDAVDEVMVTHNASGAWAIVEHVRTGEILAMVSRPAYDLNEFRRVPESARLNRAIGQIYEPGSTFKAVTIAGALNEGTVRADTVFDCEHGAWLHNRRLLRDYHPYGELTVADGVKKSSNILSAKVALTLGDQRLHDYAKAFGVGTRLGFDLPGEENGILHPVRKWSNISASRIAIGQGVAVTGLQMLGVFCAIANDGRLMRPYVIKKIVGSDGSILLDRQPQVISEPITPETAEIMRGLLLRVTQKGGTGRRAGIDGYDVAGKTGSAQKPENGGYSSSNHVASFVGFLPAANPEIAVIVVVDEPQPVHVGGVVAAPAFARIAGQTARYLDIPSSDYSVAKR